MTRPPHVRAANAGQSGDANADGYALTQDSGPWLIVAASFSGNGGEKQAQDLAAELRDRFHLHAYVHEMDFKFKDDSDNDGNYGWTNSPTLSPRRRSPRNSRARRRLRVDRRARCPADARVVKAMEPNALNVDAEPDSAKPGRSPPASRCGAGKTRQGAEARPDGSGVFHAQSAAAARVFCAEGRRRIRRQDERRR